MLSRRASFRPGGGLRTLPLAVLLLGLLAGCSARTTGAQAHDRVAPASPPGVQTPAASHSGAAQEATTPTAASGDPVAEILSRLKLEEKLGQLVVPAVYGSRATVVSEAQRAANLALYGVGTPAEVVQRYHAGGVLYLGRNPLDAARPDLPTGNLIDPLQIATLSGGLQEAAGADVGVGLLLAVDQEGGPVTRIGPPATQMPAAACLGRSGQPELAREAARVVGAELRALGITWNFAPVADVNIEPDNPVIGVRAFGSDPQLVAAFVAAQVRGSTEAGIAATAKHFPGHGDTLVDSHYGLPVLTHDRDEWARLDRPPFAAAVAAGVPAIMTAHLAVPALDPSGLPATLSGPITDELRGGLGFDGVVVTDGLWMAGVREGRSDGEVAVAALAAGADVLLTPPDLPGALRAIETALEAGQLDRGRIDASVRRVLTLKARLGLLDPPPVDLDAARSVVGHPSHAQVLDRVQAACAG